MVRKNINLKEEFHEGNFIYGVRNFSEALHLMTIYRHENEINNTQRVNFDEVEIVIYFIFFRHLFVEKIILSKKSHLNLELQLF
jgi:hypothetical protein